MLGICFVFEYEVVGFNISMCPMDYIQTWAYYISESVARLGREWANHVSYSVALGSLFYAMA